MFKQIDRVFIFANDVDRLGGIGRFMNTLGTGLHDRGYQVTLVGIAPVRDQIRYERPAEIATVTLWDDFDIADWQVKTLTHKINLARRKRNSKRRRLRDGAITKLRALIDSMDSRTAIICTQVWAMEHLLEAGLSPGSPDGPIVFGQYHGSFAEAVATNDVGRILRSYSMVDRFACLTEQDAVSFQRAGLNNSTFVHNPAAVQLNPCIQRQNEVVALARYHEHKSLHYLLNAWNELASRFPDWKLRLYGEGEERPMLERLIESENIPRATLEGVAPDVSLALASAKVHAVSSQHEGLPIAIVEAAMAGVPTVSFDCAPGIRQLIDDGHNGIVVPKNDVSALANGLATLMTDENQLARMSEAAQANSQSFSVGHITAEWERLFSNALR